MMRRTARGFVLIEVLIASLIASIIGVALFSSFFQTNRASQMIDNLIDIHSKIALAAQQMERDISGACIPAQPVDEKKSSSAKPSTSSDGKATADKKQGAEKQKEEESLPARKPQKKITHIFYGVNKEGMLDTLTFITNNPMQMYWSARAGKAQPKIARVVYRLVPEQKTKARTELSYVLMRQEDSVLDFDAYKPDAGEQIRAYELIDNIRSMSVKYGAQVPKKGAEQKPGQQKKQEKPETEYKEFDVWDLEEKKEGQEQLRKVPHDVQITLAVYDAAQDRDVSITFAIPIIPELSEPKTKQAEQQQPTAPEPPQQQQPAQPPAATGDVGEQIDILLTNSVQGNVEMVGEAVDIELPQRMVHELMYGGAE